MNLIDTSGIILFIDFIPQFNCISHLYNLNIQLFITKVVEAEYFEKSERVLNSFLETYPSLNYYIDNKIINIHETLDFEELKNRYPMLGAGELSILMLGLVYQKQNKDYVCIIDDKKARNIAEKLNLNIMGSLKLILEIKNNKIFNQSQIKQIISHIQKSPFRITDGLLDMLRN